jgi:hypothetical protein
MSYLIYLSKYKCTVIIICKILRDTKKDKLFLKKPWKSATPLLQEKINIKKCNKKIMKEIRPYYHYIHGT